MKSTIVEYSSFSFNWKSWGLISLHISSKRLCPQDPLPPYQTSQRPLCARLCDSVCDTESNRLRHEESQVIILMDWYHKRRLWCEVMKGWLKRAECFFFADLSFVIQPPVQTCYCVPALFSQRYSFFPELTLSETVCQAPFFQIMGRSVVWELRLISECNECWNVQV